MINASEIHLPALKNVGCGLAGGFCALSQRSHLGSEDGGFKNNIKIVLNRFVNVSNPCDVDGLTADFPTSFWDAFATSAL